MMTSSTTPSFNECGAKPSIPTTIHPIPQGSRLLLACGVHRLFEKRASSLGLRSKARITIFPKGTDDEFLRHLG
jgi:hypothetical protein